MFNRLNFKICFKATLVIVKVIFIASCKTFDHCAQTAPELQLILNIEIAQISLIVRGPDAAALGSSILN